MQPPTPDPAGRPPNPGKGSTGSHRPGEPSLSDLLRSTSGSSRRAPNAADLVAHLAAAENDDDAPTVITQNNARPTTPAPQPLPPPPYVVGETPSLAGRRLGHFELIESVGAGGMAAVLKARDLELGRTVALKILPPESTADPENVTRFKQEARAAARLDHENVARVYFCGEDQGLHFIAFEFVEGFTLRQLIDRRGPLPAGECVRYMIQVAAGLNHAAERGVVHRDIKPSNIIVTPDGRAKIVDMGLARHLDAGSVNGGVTQSGVTLGTFDYISPEQALDPRRADVRSDIYSLGCAFYHALTGRPPVPPGTAAKKLHAHQHLDPLDPRELNPAIPDELAAVLARMMAKNPDRRYQTPTDLIAHLKAVAAHLGLSLDAVTSDTSIQAILPDDHVLPEPPRLRIGWVAAAAAVVAAVVFIVSATGPTPAPAPTLWPGGSAAKKEELPPPPGKGTAVAPRPAEVFANTAEDLADALGKPSTTRVRLLAQEYDLTTLPRPVVFQGKQIELTGAGPRTVIRVAAPPGPRTPDDPPPGTLTLRADQVAVHRVRFELVHVPAADGQPADGTDPTGVAVFDAGTVDLQDCSFFPDEATRVARGAAVGVAPRAGERSVVKLDRCLFAPGGVGVRVPVWSSVTVSDSAFAPHAAAVLVRDDPAAANPDTDDPLPPTPVRLERSSFMLDPGEPGGVAVRVESASTPAEVSAGYCVFAPVAGAAPADGSAPRPGAVIGVAGDDVPAGVQLRGLTGQKNVYYRVDPLAVKDRNYSFEESKDLPNFWPSAAPADAPLWVALRQRPWDPPSQGGVLAPFSPPANTPFRAFRLRVAGPGADPDLTVKDVKVRVVGAGVPGAGTGSRVYDHWPPAAPVAAVAAGKRKVWWPDAPAGQQFKPGEEYRNLVVLLQEAQPGDEIAIRHTGLLAVPQLVLEPTLPGADRGELQLTFRPEPGSAPVLTPAPTSRLDLSLFRVEARVAVTFEGLHFLLKPGPDQESLAAVTLVGGQRCEFQRCTFTLDAGDRQAAAAVALADPGREMKMDGPAARSVPRVAFTNCLLRGKGRAVSVPTSRPFDLSLDNTITALNGPVLFAQAGGRDPGTALAAAVHLTRVTAFLGGPLVELHAGRVGAMRASGLVQTTVTAGGCVFAAVPGAGRSVVEVSNTEFDPSESHPVLRWKTGEPNRFANFGTVAPAVVYPGGGEVAQSWTWNQWMSFVKEVEGVGKVTFADEPDNLKDLVNLKPAHAAIKGVDFPMLEGAKPGDAGADPEKVASPPDEAKGPG